MSSNALVRTKPAPPREDVTSSGHPVLLATVDVPFDERAEVFAVDTAVELGERLIVASVAEYELLPRAHGSGLARRAAPAMESALRRPVELARSLGVEVEALFVQSLHPVKEVLRLTDHYHPGVFVLGPDRRRMSSRRYRRLSDAIRSSFSGRVWVPE